eukprot:7377796-Prymnesium_polylepis.1
MRRVSLLIDGPAYQPHVRSGIVDDERMEAARDPALNRIVVGAVEDVLASNLPPHVDQIQLQIVKPPDALMRCPEVDRLCFRTRFYTRHLGVQPLRQLALYDSALAGRHNCAPPAAALGHPVPHVAANVVLDGRLADRAGENAVV